MGEGGGGRGRGEGWGGGRGEEGGGRGRGEGGGREGASASWFLLQLLFYCCNYGVSRLTPSEW